MVTAADASVASATSMSASVDGDGQRLVGGSRIDQRERDVVAAFGSVCLRAHVEGTGRAGVPSGTELRLGRPTVAVCLVRQVDQLGAGREGGGQVFEPLVYLGRIHVVVDEVADVVRTRALARIAEPSLDVDGDRSPAGAGDPRPVRHDTNRQGCVEAVVHVLSRVGEPGHGCAAARADLGPAPVVPGHREDVGGGRVAGLDLDTQVTLLVRHAGEPVGSQRGQSVGGRRGCLCAEGLRTFPAYAGRILLVGDRVTDVESLRTQGL